MSHLPTPLTLSSWGASHSDQIQQQGGLEGPVELQGLIPKQVLKAATGTVLQHHGTKLRAHKKAQEGSDILMPHLPHLERQKAP